MLGRIEVSVDTDGALASEKTAALNTQDPFSELENPVSYNPYLLQHFFTSTGKSMSIFYFSIILTVISNVLYHIFLKILPSAIQPATSLVILYGSALAVCLLYLLFFPPAEGLLSSFQKISWANVGVGLAIVGLELGFILAYRSGWNVSLAGIVSASAVAIILLPIGIIAFREKVSPLNLLGVALCIAGLVLVNTGK